MAAAERAAAERAAERAAAERATLCGWAGCGVGRAERQRCERASHPRVCASGTQRWRTGKTRCQCVGQHEHVHVYRIRCCVVLTAICQCGTRCVSRERMGVIPHPPPK